MSPFYLLMFGLPFAFVVGVLIAYSLNGGDWGDGYDGDFPGGE